MDNPRLRSGFYKVLVGLGALLSAPVFVIIFPLLLSVAFDKQTCSS